MIIADISGERYVLASLADAETLLQILGRATAVDTGYVEQPWRSVYIKRSQPRDVSVAISGAELLDEATFAELRARDAQDEARATAGEAA